MKIIDDRLRLSASDVANFLACQHLTRLDLLSARGVLRPPEAFDLGFQDAVSQVTFYSHLLAGLQGIQPRWMHLALGNGELAPFKVAGYAAYERRARCGTGWNSAGKSWPGGRARTCPAQPSWRRRTPPRIPRSPGSGQRCWPASPRIRPRGSVPADRRAAGEGAAGRSDRLAPARGQTGVVAVLLRPHPRCRRADW
ncbi:MAG TPA: hypothetical protein VMV92_40555 [Streptosporangiaceae bacterium]|nr:hypothetical protein [Streptosporangiaceae bacterium]